MTREEIIRNLKYTMEKHKNDRVNTFDTNISVMCKDILDYLEQEPTSEMVHVETLRQVMWERDIAIEQLHELGYEFGQKIEPCEEVKRVEQRYEKALDDMEKHYKDVLEQIRKEMNDLEKKTIEDVCLDECRPCVYTTFEYVRQVINKYK